VKTCLVILIAVIVAVAAYFCVISLFVDPYLQHGTWKLISNNFAVYKNESIGETPRIYFIGNSLVLAAIEPVVIAAGAGKGQQDLFRAQLGVSFDTPLQRTIELSDIIGSRPALVIYGDSSCSFSSRYRYVPDDNLALVSAVPVPSRAGTAFRILITQYFIFMGWILFRVSDLGDIRYCITKWIFLDFSTLVAGFSKYSDILKMNAVLLGVPVIILLIVYRRRLSISSVKAAVRFDAVEYIRRLPYRYWEVFLALVLLIVFCLAPSLSPEFIYFQF